METRNKVFITAGLLVALVFIFYFITQSITKNTGYTINGNVVYSASEIENFAKCLSSKGIIMYGSRTCPHCADQKALFGDAFKEINYIECLDNPDECISLRGVPAWKINGEIIYGAQSLEKLEQLSGCKLK